MRYTRFSSGINMRWHDFKAWLRVFVMGVHLYGEQCVRLKQSVFLYHPCVSCRVLNKSSSSPSSPSLPLPFPSARSCRPSWSCRCVYYPYRVPFRQLTRLFTARCVRSKCACVRTLYIMFGIVDSYKRLSNWLEHIVHRTSGRDSMVPCAPRACHYRKKATTNEEEKLSWCKCQSSEVDGWELLWHDAESVCCMCVCVSECAHAVFCRWTEPGRRVNGVQCFRCALTFCQPSTTASINCKCSRKFA